MVNGLAQCVSPFLRLQPTYTGGIGVKEISKAREIYFTVKLDDELDRMLREMAAREERSRGQILRRLIRKAAEELARPQPK